MERGGTTIPSRHRSSTDHALLPPYLRIRHLRFVAGGRQRAQSPGTGGHLAVGRDRGIATALWPRTLPAPEPVKGLAQERFQITGSEYFVAVAWPPQRQEPDDRFPAAGRARWEGEPFGRVS